MSETKPIDDGGTAFPCQPLDGQGQPCGSMQYGLSIRDWFAGQALIGLFAQCGNPDNDGITASDYQAAGQHAYIIADMMLLARARKVADNG